MTSTNLNIVLTNALCCISAQAAKVSKLYSIGNGCVESEVQKLKLMNDWFEALRCYNANTSIASKFLLRIDYATYNSAFLATSNVNRNYVLTVNGTSYTVQGDGTTPIGTLIGTLVGTIDNISNLNAITDPDGFSPRYVYLYLDGLCDVTEINYQVIRISDNTVLTDIDWTLYQQGYCTVTNCLTEEQADIMMHDIMRQCDICDCQLTT